MLFEKAAILGIGLIGSSLARCLKQNGDVKTLAVYDENSANLQKPANWIWPIFMPVICAKPSKTPI